MHRFTEIAENLSAELSETYRTIADETIEITADYEDDYSIGESIKLLENDDATGWEHDSMVRVAHRCFDLGVTPTTLLVLFDEHWPFELDDGEDLEYQLSHIAKAREAQGKQWGVDHPRRRPTVYATFERVEMTQANAPRAEAGARDLGDFSLAEFEGREIPPRPWLVRDLVPDHAVTILTGDGGVGKSLLALQFAVAVVAARPWIGLECEHGPAIYVSAEDDRDEIHRRADDIRKAEGLTFADLAQLHVVPLAGLDAVMGTPNASGGISPTKLWAAFAARARRLRPRLIVLDTLADVFGGDEIVRVQARQFVGQLRGLAIELKCASLLLAHPSLSGMASGAGTSGSTAWSNSVRGRLYLTRPTDEAQAADANLRVLSTKKMNYAGGVGDERLLRWEAGRFKPETPRVRIEGGDLLAAFARTLREGFVPGEKVAVTHVYDAMPAAAQADLGSRSNIARRIKELMLEAGRPMKRGKATIPTGAGEFNLLQSGAPTAPLMASFSAPNP